MSRRASVGGSLLIVSACVSAGWQLARIAVRSAPEERSPSIVADYDERRFTGLAGALEAGEIIGYVTNEPDSPEATRSYYLAQYVLAPAVIVRDDAREVVIVDDRPECAGRARAHGRLLCDWGNGVRLVGREGP